MFLRVTLRRRQPRVASWVALEKAPVVAVVPVVVTTVGKETSAITSFRSRGKHPSWHGPVRRPPPELLL